MAVPKKRTSRARRDRRRATHRAAKARVNYCPGCYAPKMPHRVCPSCGQYAGREIVSTGPAIPDPTPQTSDE